MLSLYSTSVDVDNARQYIVLGAFQTFFFTEKNFKLKKRKFSYS